MKKLFFIIGFTFLIAPLLLSQVGKVGINTTTPAAMLHVKDSSVVFTGTVGFPGTGGPPPVTGAGNRMMWYVDKAAFRAGYAMGSEWDKDSIGILSLGIGNNVKAKGYASIALGQNASGTSNFAIAINGNATGPQSMAIGSLTTASGFNALCMGNSAVASGNGAIALAANSIASGGQAVTLGGGGKASGSYSTAMGEFTEALSSGSTSMGSYTNAIGSQSLASGYSTEAIGSGSFSGGYFTAAIGNYSFAIGDNTKAKSYSSMVFGRFNDTTSISSLGWNLNDPVFIIGNGTSNTSRSNALTVLKNGNTGINTTSPDAILHAIKDTPTNGPYNSNAAAIFEGDQGSFIQLSNDNAIQSGILSGNKVTAIRSALIFAADSSMQIRTGGNTTRLLVEKTGNIGIGTAAPQRLLHIQKASSGGTPNTSAIAVFENNSDASISLLTPNANESGIFFGNPSNSAHGGIVYNSTVANGLAFRTNGNSTRAVITSTGDMGIGDNSPNARLHVANGSSGNTPVASSVLAVESSTDASINILTPNADESAIYFGNPANSVHGGIVYNSAVANGLEFRANGNSTKAVITSTGDMGIGDQTPNARLHVNGGTGGGNYSPEADMIIEDDNDAFLQFSTLDAESAGVLSGRTTTSVRSGILFQPDSSILFRAGGNTTRLTLDKSGNSTLTGNETVLGNETVSGNSTVTGIVTATGEIRRTSTGTSNVVPIAYGSVSPGTPPVIQSGTGNFTVTNPNVGEYQVTITGESFNNNGFSALVTPISSAFRSVSIGASGNNLVIRIWNNVFAQVDNHFHFVVYKN